jgi:1-acyl-sn-glycerol-3-phosphate acyltransferase
MHLIPVVLTVSGLLLGVAAVTVFYALRCSAGWQAWLLYTITRVYARLFLRWRSNRPCPFPEDAPCIIIANHTSPVDPMLIWAFHASNYRRHHIRVPNFLMAREYSEKGGLVGWIAGVMQSISVDRNGRDMRSVRAALRRLQQGRLVGVFPEGGINQTPSCLTPGNSGAAWLALKSGVPVYPVFIHDAPRGTTMISSFYTRTKVRISYGEPIDLSKWAGTKPNAEILAEVTDTMMRALATLGGVEYSRHGLQTVPPTNVDAG